MTRIDNEKRTVELMIRLYCRHREANAELCPACRELLGYAHQRLAHCRWGEGKPTCRKCPVHCYKPSMREKMRQVMRWSGPRMIIYAPWDALKHTLRELNVIK